MNRPSDLNMYRQMLAWGYMHQASTATGLDHTLASQDGDGANRAEGKSKILHDVIIIMLQNTIIKELHQ